MRLSEKWLSVYAVMDTHMSSMQDVLVSISTCSPYQRVNCVESAA